MSIRRIKALAKKEFLQMRRDIRSLISAIFIPLLMIFLFGYALSLDVDRIPTVVLDLDGTPASRGFIQALSESRYFQIVRYLDRQSEIDGVLARGEALMALVIPTDFSSRVNRGVQTRIQAIFDGTDSNTASIAIGYLKAIRTGMDLDLKEARLQRAGYQMAETPVEPRLRVWFNPEMKSKNFIIPGLTAVIMMVICAVMTALTISREKETGTMEQLISTPVTSTELIVGKLLPYVGVGVIDLAMVVGTGIIIFDVPFRGSYLDLGLTSLIFLIGTLGWGLFLSVAAKTQLQASQLAMVTAFLPSFLLSGFIYPIENMPAVLQAITYVVPARYFVEVLRGLFLKGVGLDYLWPQLLALSAYAFVVFFVTIRKFSKRLV